MPGWLESIAGVDPGLIAAWTRAWARSRGVPPPERRAGAWYVLDGRPGQKARYVFARPGDDYVALARAIEEPEVVLKVCAPARRVAPLLPPRWRVLPPGYFMTTALAAHDGGRA